MEILETNLKTENLRLARVKYFDKEKGVELTEIEAYAFLMNINGEYVNVFDICEALPVLERSKHYANTFVPVCGEMESGPCYAIEPRSVKGMMGQDTISFEMLREYVLKSNLFFVDRVGIIDNEKPLKRFIYQSLREKDEEKLSALKEYIASHENAKVYQK